MNWHPKVFIRLATYWEVQSALSITLSTVGTLVIIAERFVPLLGAL